MFHLKYNFADHALLPLSTVILSRLLKEEVINTVLLRGVTLLARPLELCNHRQIQVMDV